MALSIDLKFHGTAFRLAMARSFTPLNGRVLNNRASAADDNRGMTDVPSPDALPSTDQPVPAQEPTHKRRVRYQGTHPKKFEEKYKELDPGAHADEVLKVMQRGQTPAGMHRPICVAEILGVLKPQPGEIGLDATLGFGGHSQELLPLISPNGHLFALDVDPLELPRSEARLRKLGFDERALTVRRMNFSGIQTLLPDTLTEAGGGFDFILADLGVSSMQIDNPARGFSFKLDGPLDLRLDPSQGVSAFEFLLAVGRAELRDILIDNADEPHAAVLAAALQGQYLQTTTELAELVHRTVSSALPVKLPEGERKVEIKKAQQRTFQALRIAVNHEFTVLDAFLAALPACLKPGGRVAILSFHSGEDRRVKKAFQAGERSGIYAAAAPDFVRPSFDEQRANPRSSSAKLRWAVRA
jgi:16S rRNA (cytosine1402-N4)-methyltransferase